MEVEYERIKLEFRRESRHFSSYRMGVTRTSAARSNILSPPLGHKQDLQERDWDPFPGIP